MPCKKCRSEDGSHPCRAFFSRRFDAARRILHSQGYLPYALSKSRSNQRLHRISGLFLTQFLGLGKIWKALNTNSIDMIDSFSLRASDNERIPRSKRSGEVSAITSAS